MNPLPQVEKSFQPTQSIGVRIRDLPESCTDELLFTQVFQKLNIDIKKVKAMKVKGHKTFQNCLGDAIVFFDTEDAAQDAMSKIIGTTLHEKIINCSRMMAPADLKLKNGKNVYVKNIKSGVTLQEFLLAAQKHGTVLSVILKENSIGKLDGYANYISSAVAEEAQKKGITIVSQNKEVTYAAKVLTAEGRDAPKKGKMPTIGRNIELHFDAPLVNGAIEVADFENQLREQISKKFNLLPTSIFVWGTRARHFSKNSEQTLQDAFNLVNNEATKDCGAPNAKGEHGCYNNPVGTTCPVLNYFHKKAFVCFETKAEAQELLNQFYGKYITESAEDKTLFDFTFTKGEETVTVKTERCIPENSSQDKKFKELEERLNPKIIDKNYIFLKNLKKDVTVEDVTNAIQGLCAAKVQSVKLSVPTIENFIKDPSKPTETKFATIYLDNKQEAEKFISQFKQNPDFREKFQIFEGYKYANYLAPKKIHLQDLKNKNNNQNKRQQAKPVANFTNQFFAQYLPTLMPFQKLNPNFLPKNGAFPTFTFPMGNKPFLPQNYPTIRGNNQGQNYRNNSQPPQYLNRNQNQAGNTQPNKQGSFNPRPFGQQHSAGRNYVQHHNKMQQQQGGEPRQRFTPHYQQNRSHPNNQNTRHFDNKNKNTNTFKNNQQGDKKAPQQAPISDKPTVAPKPQIPAIPKIEDIKDKTEVEQKQMLGIAILPRITAVLSETNKDKANKIAGMLVDFEIYTAEEIIEMLNSPEELKENIDTALELIQDQTQQ